MHNYFFSSQEVNLISKKERIRYCESTDRKPYIRTFSVPSSFSFTLIIIHQHYSKNSLIHRFHHLLILFLLPESFLFVSMSTTMKIFGFMLLMITTFTVLLSCSSATVYKVGDSDGWTAKDGMYRHWAEGKEFHVGDSLVFEYDRNFNDVTEVSGALELEFCDSSTPKAVYNSGHDVVTLKEPGYHHFISSNQSQCTSGQRLEVLVVHDLSLPTPPPLPRKILPFGKTYKVGDSQGWNVYDSDFYNKWSEEKDFHVGYNLLFKYDNEVNDVIEINGDLEFKACDPTSPVAVYKTGHDLVRLTEPGVHYFISSKTGHCEAGLKLRVVVSVPKLSPIDRLIRWLRTFRLHHH